MIKLIIYIFAILISSPPAKMDRLFTLKFCEQ